jgi:predicted DNA-binding transcriptional regulator AlpA
MAKNSNQQRALAALIESSSIREASIKSGIGETTFYRFLKDAEFLKQYRQARRAMVENAITQAQAATNEAVETLKRNLNCEQPSVEIRAAALILDSAIKGVELIDVIERLEILENELEKQNGQITSPNNRKRF